MTRGRIFGNRPGGVADVVLLETHRRDLGGHLLTAAVKLEPYRPADRSHHLEDRVLPAVELLAVGGEQAVADLEAGGGGPRARLHMPDDRSNALQIRNLDPGHENDRDQGHGEDDVHRRPRQIDQESLPPWLVQKFPRIRGDLPRIFATQLDVAAERQKRDSIVGLTPLKAEEALAEAQRKGQDLGLEGLGDEEVTRLVNEDDRSEAGEKCEESDQR